MALIIDASESVDRLFDEQIRFVIERVVQNVNVHPDAVRWAVCCHLREFSCQPN
uniref:Transcriptional regulator n=1 Tax=Ascaris lumbricoides TaxID=6252 RepID=A0A0M3HJH2_ASCLU